MAGSDLSKGAASSETVASPADESSQDGATGGIGEGREGGAQRVGLHLVLSTSGYLTSTG